MGQAMAFSQIFIEYISGVLYNILMDQGQGIKMVIIVNHLKAWFCYKGSGHSLGSASLGGRKRNSRIELE